ncbi:MAG: hypothetical protein ACE5EQ_08850 [Phycisphaerae bacterium]
MVSEREAEPFDPLSDDIWYLDTESIYDNGDYRRIAERMRGLAGGDLPIEQVEDYVDMETNEAWLSFKLDEALTKWEAELNDDWLDSSIMTRFSQLLIDRGAGSRYTIVDFEGQDCLIGCSTPGKLDALRRLTGLPFQWLT